MIQKHQGSPVQEVNDPELKDSGIRLLIKRDDLIHEHISGNKWRKLKFNLREAAEQNHHTILTLGGAYSNHIAATAFAAQKSGFSSIGVVRGEDDATNPTLKFAREHGMQLHFVSRGDYREMTRVGAYGHTPVHPTHSIGACRGTPLQRGASESTDGNTPEKRVKEKFGRCFIIPEGGANGLGVRGCTEILQEVEEDYDVVCCAAGTGATLAGLALSMPVRANGRTPLLGFPALKGGEFLTDEVERLMDESRLRQPSTQNFQLITDYHFGGYAKLKPELLEFINGFQERTGIPLDPIYTGKMMYGIYDMIRIGAYGDTFTQPTHSVGACRGTPLRTSTTILAIHTGGLQGWAGMKHRGLV